MSQVHVSAERLINAPAALVYHCIADYREHHRPDGFLPPVFSDFRIEQGGVGAGTVISFAMTLGGRTRHSTQSVSEPEPGRVLVESGDGVRTTFTVEPRAERCKVRFDTVLEAKGLNGLLLHLLAGRLLRPVYADELERLDRHARAHEPLVAAR